MGIRISKDHLHPSVIESITSLIGDLDQLETTAKGNAVEAINELLANGGNKEELEALIAEIAEGKELIANAVGEPLTAEESFDEMSNDINSLLSTFKTNMMNNGVTVQSGDKFKQLIDKIATMVEEGSGKGIQYASGDAIVNVSEGGIAVKNEADNMSDSMYLAKITDLGFKPHICVCVCDLDGNGRYIITSVYTEDSGMFFTNQTGSVQYGVYKPTESLYVSNDEITMPFKSDFFGSDKYTKYYAIGVGEEDTTLRDSLASILENKGVDVTEEDDMASLISKTDNLIATLNDNALVLDSTFESGYDVSIFSSDGNYTSSTADWNLVLCIDVKRPGTYNCSFNAKTNSSGNMCTVDLYYPNTTEGNCIYSKSFSSTTAVTCSETFTFDTPGQLYFNLTCPVSYYQAILSDIVLKSKINL